MKSMTGYGKGMVAGDDFSVSVDLKTVNNRFLDIHLRVGSELASVEPSIKKRITSRLSRGRVDVTVSMERAAQVAYELNRPLIAGYVNALKQLQQDFNIAGELDINVIARIPGALQPARNGIDERMITALEQAWTRPWTNSKRCASRKAKHSGTNCATEFGKLKRSCR